LPPPDIVVMAENGSKNRENIPGATPYETYKFISGRVIFVEVASFTDDWADLKLGDDELCTGG